MREVLIYKEQMNPQNFKFFYPSANEHGAMLHIRLQ